MSKPRPPRKTVPSASNASIENGIRRIRNPPTRVVRYKSVHERQFYHSESTLPYTIDADVADLTDSEDDFQLMDIEHHRKIIDENRRLSTNQKKIANLWNEFIEKCKKFGVKQMKIVCKAFIEAHIDQIRHEKLYNDLMLHLCWLHDGNLLTPNDFYALVKHLHVQHMGIQQYVMDKNIQEPANDKENRKRGRKRKRSSSTSEADGLEPRQKQQRYSLRAQNGNAD